MFLRTEVDIRGGDVYLSVFVEDGRCALSVTMNDSLSFDEQVEVANQLSSVIEANEPTH